MKKLNKKGFTLVELLAVIVVTTLVLGLSSYGIINAYKSSKDTTIVLNEKSILEAARINSTESDKIEWKELNNKEYFCTTIQRLKNVGLLKKNAKSEEHDDFSLIAVKRDITTSNVEEISFVSEEDTTMYDLCDIKYFTVHYDYNVVGETGTVPNDQRGEVSTKENIYELSISSVTPKRDDYKFLYWNTKSDGTGVRYLPGSRISSFGEGTINLYAIWKEDSYTINYRSNITGATGTTSRTKCIHNKNCTLSENGFTKNGYTFVGWNTKSDYSGTTYSNAEVVYNLTDTSSITLYAKWKSAHKAIIKYNVGNNGVITSSTTSSDGINYRWRTDASGTISRSKNNGAYTSEFFSIDYGESKDLVDYNNSKYMKITNSSATVSTGSIWKCISGECNGNTFNQTSNYNSNDFCNALTSDCTVVLAVNWETLLSPIFIPSDSIESGHVHNASYTLTITSENTGSVTYQYKVDNGSYQTYTGPITPSEGTHTYTARTKRGTSYSGTVSYISIFNSLSVPDKPTIYNPTNGNWTNTNFSVILNKDGSDESILYYEYKYANDTNWTRYENSAGNNFETTEFSKERDENVSFRACNSVGCSEENSTRIRIDKTNPSISFKMKNGNNVTYDYTTVETTVPSWINYAPTLIWETSDQQHNGVRSGININLADNFGYNNSGNNTLNANIIGHLSIAGNSNGVFSTTLNSSNSDGYRYIEFNVCDNAGNCVVSDIYVKIDRVAPDIPAISNPTNGNWTNTSFAVTLQSSDAISGINYYQYKYANTASTAYSNSSTENFETTNFSAERNELVYFSACDKAGNCSNYSSTYIRIDKTKPNVPTIDLRKWSQSDYNTYNSNNNNKPTSAGNRETYQAGTWYKYPVFTTASSSDNSNGSGINHYEITVTGASTNKDNYSTTYWNGIANGTSYVKYRACDNAGNCSNYSSSNTIKVDKIAPNIPVISNPTNGNWTNTSFAVTLQSSDATSGINYYQYKYANTDWTTYSNSSTENFETTNFSAERNELAYFRACDNAGNCSGDSSTYIRIDKTTPTISFQLLNGNTAASSDYYSSSPSNSLKWFTFNPTLSWTASDTLSKINSSSAKYYYNTSKNEEIDGNETLSGSSASGITTTNSGNNYTFNIGNWAGGYRKVKIDVCDNAGNCVDDTKYFKYYENSVVGRYVSAYSGINCRVEPKTSSSPANNGYNCGDYLSSLIKTYTGDWYYNTNANCYVDGQYLSTYQPNCSSGGGGTSSPGSCRCNIVSDCIPNVGYSRDSCSYGYCFYKRNVDDVIVSGCA